MVPGERMKPHEETWMYDVRALFREVALSRGYGSQLLQGPGENFKEGRSVRAVTPR